jgi:hypothetical protein
MMSSEAADLRVEVVLEADGDAAELDGLTRALSRELGDLRPGRVDRRAAGPAPPGTRTGIPIDPGTLMVSVEHGGPALVELVRALRSWLDRRRAASTRPSPTIRIRVGRHEAELTAGELSPDQRRLLDAFLAAFPER